MSASYALLGILGRQPSYGYELKRDYDFFYGNQKPLAFGQVYATLSRLLRDKKIDSQATEQVGGPERKLYAITEAGRTDLDRWLATPEVVHPDAQTVFFIKVVSAILLNREPAEFLDVQRAAHLDRMRQLTAFRKQGDLAQLLRADYALFHLEADLRWIDLTEARLQQLKNEIRTREVHRGE
jgi:DNA-binding PadR family transcriptional regulator